MLLTHGELKRLIREAAYAGMFAKGDHVLFGKYKNKKGKIADIYMDDKGHPVIDIEPIPKGRKKNVTMGLYKIWKPDEDFNEEKLNESIDRNWIVRGGERVLVRRENETPNDWRWHNTNKVQYFTDADMVSGPETPTKHQTWVFRKAGWLIAVDEENFFSRPNWEHPRRW